jgi:hypothetical protein
MGKQPENAHKQWTRAQKTELKELARRNTPTGLIAHDLRRTESAVRTKASELDISLKPTNQSPYNRKSGK